MLRTVQTLKERYQFKDCVTVRVDCRDEGQLVLSSSVAGQQGVIPDFLCFLVGIFIL